MTDKKEKILVVDDEQNILDGLEMLLDFDGYEVIKANSGRVGLDMLNVHDVAVIICDQNMPEIRGDEVLRKVSELKPDIGRIMLTGEGDISVAVRSINYSQVDYFLQKPWEVEVLRKTVRDTVERYRLVRENSRLEKVNIIQNEELAKAHQQLQNELQFGAKIHQHLLLGKVPENIPNFDVSVFTQPSNNLDGDFYDFYQTEAEKIDLVVGDVMGKGIPAALAGTAVKNQFSRFTQPFVPTSQGPKRFNSRTCVPETSEILYHVHNEINSKLLELEMFVCLFYGRFDIRRHLFTFLDCGSCKPILYRNSEHQTELLSGDNFPLGMVEKDSYEATTVSYSPKDMFVFYSDGVTEATSPDGEMYGIDRLRNLVEENHFMTPKKLTETIKFRIQNSRIANVLRMT